MSSSSSSPSPDYGAANSTEKLPAVTDFDLVTGSSDLETPQPSGSVMESINAQFALLHNFMRTISARLDDSATSVPSAPVYQAPIMPAAAAVASYSSAVRAESREHAAAVESITATYQQIFDGSGYQGDMALQIRYQVQLLNEMSFPVAAEFRDPRSDVEAAINLLHNPWLDPWSCLPIYDKAISQMSIAQSNAALSSNNSILALGNLHKQRNIAARTSNGVPIDESVPGCQLSAQGWIVALSNLNLIIGESWRHVKRVRESGGGPQNLPELYRIWRPLVPKIGIELGHLALVIQKLTFTDFPPMALQLAVAQTWKAHSLAVTLARRNGTAAPVVVFNPASTNNDLHPSIIHALEKHANYDSGAEPQPSAYLSTHSRAPARPSEQPWPVETISRRQVAADPVRVTQSNLRSERKPRPCATESQHDSLKAVTRLPNKNSYEFKVCPAWLDTSNATRCPADSSDKCADYHVCYHCFRKGKSLTQCLGHKPGDCTDKIGGATAAKRPRHQ